MNCREFVDFLMNYLDGELARPQHKVFEDHIRACPECEDYLENYKEAVQVGRAVCREREDVPEDVPEELVQAILSARKAS